MSSSFESREQIIPKSARGLPRWREAQTLATKQGGVISREQLRLLRFAPSTVHWALTHGRLAYVCRGIYRLGNLRPSWRHLAFATTRLLFPGSALSHFSAAHLYGLPDCSEPITGLSLIVPWRMKPSIDDFVEVTRSRVPFGLVKQGDYLVTTLARTLIDLAELATPRRLEVLLDAAALKDRRLIENLRVELALFRRHKRPGLDTLRKLLDARTGKGPESPLETSANQLQRESGLPPWVCQHDILEPDGRFITRADFAFIELMIAVFVDSVQHHHGRVAFDRDAAQRSRASVNGWTCIIITATSLKNGQWLKDLKDAIAMRTREKANK